MQISLKKLSIKNFKGVKDFEAEFNHVTNVYGMNASGKTSLFDAFLWLFFGKNSEDVSVFEVKRLDAAGKFIRDLESEVEAIIHTGDQEVSVKKVLRQKWVKRRGELTPNYNGDENVYFWNDVPLKESEFKAKIKAIIDESLFRLITNPFYFNSLKWQERRNILVSLAGDITNEEILDKVMTVQNAGTFAQLVNAFNQKKSIDEFKSEIAVKKKRIKDEMEQIHPRIDEVRKGMPATMDFEAIRSESNQLKDEAEDLAQQIIDEVAQLNAMNQSRTKILQDYNNSVTQKQQRSFDLKSKIQNIEFAAKQYAKDHSGNLDSDLRSVENQIENKTAELTRYTNAVAGFNTDLITSNTKLDELRNQYEVISDEELPETNDHDFKCPTCKQALPATNIEAKKEELYANFNKKKVERLEALNSQAMQLKANIENLEKRIAQGKSSIDNLSAEIDKLNTEKAALANKKSASKTEQQLKDEYLNQNDTYKTLVKDLEANEAMVITEPVFEPAKQNAELVARKNELAKRIAELDKELNKEDQIKACEKRIVELEEIEAKQSQVLANLEGVDYAIMQFTKAKVDMIEDRINGKFQTVKFRMFDVQVNGGETETCETLVNSNGSWVPFSDANNAAKVNAGLDIINTLCRHYNAHAPVFLDNRESVTNIIDTDSQLVNLIVSGVDKTLRVA